MPTVTPSLITALQKRLGKAYVLSTPEVLKTYENDACMLMCATPELVVLPANAEEVSAAIKLCDQHNVPFVARGSGTGLSGGALPVLGGVIIGLSRMNRILEIDPEAQTATVEAGVINAWLNREAKAHGLFYAPDPSSQAACSIGGNIAENAGGIHCVKYGVTQDHILALQVVTPEGQILWLGGKHGQVSHIDWKSLWVGSEGTFGVVTQAIVKLTPQPEFTEVYLASFDRLENATDLVSEIMASGLVPSALELIDDVTIRAVNDAFNVGFPQDAEAVLLIEIDGSALAVEAMRESLQLLLQRYPIQQLRVATDEAERQTLWKARKGAVAAYGRILPAFYLHDCVIPRSELTPVLRQIQAIGQKHQVIIGNVFHAGDGNLHPNILLDPDDADMVARVLAAGEEILDACLAVGGVLSGEHGIGMEKNEFMLRQFTPDELDVMQRVKQVFDSAKRCNPGKLFPTGGGCGEASKGLPHKLVQSGAGWI